MNVGAQYIKGKDSWLKHLDFIILDILALVLSFVISYIAKFHDFHFLDIAVWKELLVIAALLDLVIILFTGVYSGVSRRFGGEELIKTILQSLYNFVLICILLYVMKTGEAYSRTVIIMTYVLYVGISFLIRQGWKKVLKSSKLSAYSNRKKTILVIGNRVDMPQYLRSINSDFFLEYDVQGICVADGEIGEEITSRIDVLDEYGRVKKVPLTFENTVKLEDIAQYVLDNNIAEVFIGVAPSRINKKTYETLVANGKGIHINVESMIGFKTDDQFVTRVGTYKTLSVGRYSFTGKQLVYLVIKRLMDIFFGIIGVILMFPMILVIKISYLLSGDTKSIFYTQTRVGLGGQTFKMYKFRSMVYNANEILEEMLKDEKYRKEWEENQKFEDDPRITKIGHILRKTSLDEFPQFINVLKGEMSLIGPRPLIVGELEMHNGLQLYQQVQPGITGWWGCNGRSNTTYEERLELEYFYVKNCSLYLDALCIVKTIGVVLKKDGAK